jgi:hypothetical protein
VAGNCAPNQSFDSIYRAARVSKRPRSDYSRVPANASWSSASSAQRSFCTLDDSRKPVRDPAGGSRIGHTCRRRCSLRPLMYPPLSCLRQRHPAEKEKVLSAQAAAKRRQQPRHRYLDAISRPDASEIDRLTMWTLRADHNCLFPRLQSHGSGGPRLTCFTVRFNLFLCADIRLRKLDPISLPRDFALMPFRQSFVHGFSPSREPRGRP